MGRLLAACVFGIGLASASSAPTRANGPVPSAPVRDPAASCVDLEQGAMTHVFDTRDVPGGPFYVNDHTIVQAPDGSWHLFGIFKKEPMGDDNEVDFVHAVATEPSPAKWEEGAFEYAGIVLTADRSRGETHLWAPHVIRHAGRWLMFYNGGGRDDDHASMRLAESVDLQHWSRVGLLFEDFCAARDPMVVEKDGVFSIFYTRCESLWHKVSGVAKRTSTDLVHWSEPTMALTMGEDTLMPNSGYSESPFVFERNGIWMMSVTAYPRAWDGTLLFRSPGLAFSDEPFARLRAHAGEWIVDDRGRTFLTHAGPGQYGVWIAPVRGL